MIRSSFAACYQIVGALLACTTIGYLIVLVRMFERLRRHDAQTYARLGRPTLLMNNTLKNGLRVTRYLLMREYSSAVDQKVRLLAGVARWALIASLVLAALIILLPFAIRSIA